MRGICRSNDIVADVRLVLDCFEFAAYLISRKKCFHMVVGRGLRAKEVAARKTLRTTAIYE